MPDPHFLARSPFEGLHCETAPGRGVVAIDRAGLGLANVLVKRGRTDALGQQVRERYGLELPREPRRAAAGDLAFACVGPGAWIATHEQGGIALAHAISEIGDLAAIADQCDGYPVLRLTGPKVREALAKLLPLDLHPRAFPVGIVASTAAAHIGVTLWRLADHHDGAVFEIVVFRSLATSFWHSLTESAAEFGFEICERR